MRQLAWRRLLSVMGLWFLLGLQGCGTPWATVRDGRGRPVMLLGYDPVAYVTRGQPARGDPAFSVDLPEANRGFAGLGSIMVNRVNDSDELAPMLLPCAVTMDLAMARPSPVPSLR